MPHIQPPSPIAETKADQLLMTAQANFYKFKSAGMMEKPALAEGIMQNLLDALQMMAADVRELRKLSPDAGWHNSHR